MSNMQINRETDYAISCILHMAKKPEDVFALNEIAKHQFIPKIFLAKILQKAVKAGIVRSYRGTRGGFQLSRKPEEISLLDVIDIIEGPILLNMCVADPKKCSISDTCSVYPVWVKLKELLENQLRSYSFADLTINN